MEITPIVAREVVTINDLDDDDDDIDSVMVEETPNK